MAKKKVSVSANVVERNIRLTGEIMNYLLNHPQIFGALPDKFELVVLPEDDPEMRLYNLDLLDKLGSEGRPIVFARITSQSKKVSGENYPSLFVPVSVAA